MGNNVCGYYEMRGSFLTNCYVCCRSHALTGAPWTEGETAGGFAYSQMEGAYTEDIELLMIEVIAMMVDFGHPPREVHEEHMRRARKALERVGEDGIFSHLQGIEADEFRYDLQLLGLIGA